MSSKNTMADFDGFYLIPKDDGTEVEYRFFRFNDDVDMGKPVDGNDFGPMYHVAFFKRTDKGVEFDDVFEAIFADPITYARGLYGTNLHGTFLKKTENSSDWWDDYLKGVMGRVMIQKMKKYAEAIAEAK